MADSIIVVIGSVSSRQYHPLRMPYLRKGEKVRIMHIPPDDCEWQGEDGELTFCDNHRIDPDQVVEAIITEADYNRLTRAASDFVFDHEEAPYWRNLRHLSVVRSGPGGVWIDEA